MADPFQKSLCLRGMRTYVINLERRPDRRQRIMSLAEALELNCTLVPGIDGRYLHNSAASQSEAVAKKRNLFELHWCASTSSAGKAENSQRMMSHKVRIKTERPEIERWTVLGCLLSHKEVLKRMLSEGLDHALVLEDDGMLSGEAEEIHERFREGTEAMTIVCPEWKVLYLGGVLGFKSEKSTRESMRIPGTSNLICGASTYQAHAYIIRRSAIEEVCSKLDEGFAADAALASASRHDQHRHSTHFFRFFPPLIRQRGGGHRRRDSDITIGEATPRKRRKVKGKLANEENKEPVQPTDLSLEDEKSLSGECAPDASSSSAYKFASAYSPCHEGMLAKEQSRELVQPTVLSLEVEKSLNGECAPDASSSSAYKFASAHSQSHEVIPPLVAPTWTCERCTVENLLSNDCCEVCDGPKQRSNADMIWICDKCTLENRISSSTCEVCNQPRRDSLCNADEGAREGTIACWQSTLENSKSDAKCRACDAQLVVDAPSKGAQDKIACWQCTLENLSSATKCQACDAQLVVHATSKGWACPSCTLENESHNANCVACGFSPRWPSTRTI